MGDARAMGDIPDRSVALVVTSPPYFVGKEYERQAGNAAGDCSVDAPDTYGEYLGLLGDVFGECVRVLEPGGRLAVNVANLGRKPYRSLSADVIGILQELGLLLRGEIVWRKASAARGSCAWGSFRSPANPVLRDVTERIIVASKGRFDRAIPRARRRELGLPHLATSGSDEFMEATLDVWTMPAESARGVGRPAPFPVELPLRLIHLYTYEGDLVLDPFMTEGTALVAARRSLRRGVGYDTDPRYVDIARERLDQTVLDSGARERRGPVGSARAVARGALEESGFEIIAVKRRVAGVGLNYDFLVENRHGQRWFVDVAGGFTTIHPGLQRSQVVWETLGRAHVLRSAEPLSRVLVLTASLPSPGSEGRRALEAVGPDGLFDIIEIFSEADLRRLRLYAADYAGRPVPGWWDEERIARGLKEA